MLNFLARLVENETNILKTSGTPFLEYNEYWNAGEN